MSLKKQNIVILGSTGTIGVNTLDVIAQHSDLFEVFALTGQTQLEKLARQCRRFRPRYVVVSDEASADKLHRLLRNEEASSARIHERILHKQTQHQSCEVTKAVQNEILSAGKFIMPEICWGNEALKQVATHPEVDTVMAAIVGAACLPASLAAVMAGKRILLANKEALVMAGDFFMQAARQNQATILPVDSEHSAIFQCLSEIESFIPKQVDWQKVGVNRLILTASGGPFRGKKPQELQHITPDQACAHPNWVMGQKISVDSATMMNKGLEVIEAFWLFSFPADKIDVIVHPQSIIHSMVQFCDGSVMAQMGTPDMKTPIAYALGHPKRLATTVTPLDFTQLAQLSFEAPDRQTFRCLDLAFESLKMGGSASAVLNAANEITVAAFLQQRIGFLDIAKHNAWALDHFGGRHANSIEDLFALDCEVRARLSAKLGSKAW